MLELGAFRVRPSSSSMSMGIDICVPCHSRHKASFGTILPSLPMRVGVGAKLACRRPAWPRGRLRLGQATTAGRRGSPKIRRSRLVSSTPISMRIDDHVQALLPAQAALRADGRAGCGRRSRRCRSWRRRCRRRSMRDEQRRGRRRWLRLRRSPHSSASWSSRPFSISPRRRADRSIVVTFEAPMLSMSMMQEQVAVVDMDGARAAQRHPRRLRPCHAGASRTTRGSRLSASTSRSCGLPLIVSKGHVPFFRSQTHAT